MIERLAHAGLVLDALVFAGFGVAFTVAPEAILASVDVAIATPVAATELRAVYGGLQAGLAAFLGVCALRREWVLLGLLAGTLALGGLGLWRLAGMVADGTLGSPVLWALLVPELLGAGLNALLALALRRAQPMGTSRPEASIPQ